MKILTVSELTFAIKKNLEEGFRSICVRGEVSNLKKQASGHIYFTLKDKESQISSVLFRGIAIQLNKEPKDGDALILKGELSLYAPRGTYQFIVRELSYAGIGELLTMLHERKARFSALGYFDKSHKKPLPTDPKIIGVITSSTGSVIQDIIQVLQRRHSGFSLLLYPVKVQGPGAKEEIAKGIELFNKHNLADVLIVGRGGGSLEDLWAFNEEIVVEAIFRSTIPIISAVGHETDFSLCDFTADVRAPTPSAAAEIVVAEKKQHYAFLSQIKKRLDLSVKTNTIRLQKELLQLKKNPYITSPYLLLSRKLQGIDDLKGQIDGAFLAFLQKKRLHLYSLQKQAKTLAPSTKIGNSRIRLSNISKGIYAALSLSIHEKRKRLDPEGKKKRLLLYLKQSVLKKKEMLQNVSSHLSSIDPKNLLSKGYCILFSENQDSVILSTKQLAKHQKIKLLLKDGTITAKTEEITYESIGSHKL